MIRIYVFLFGMLLMASSIAEDFPSCRMAEGEATTLSIPSQLIRVSADLLPGIETPIAQFDSNTVGQRIVYLDCPVGTEYGKQANGLTGPAPDTKIYQTNIPGIGIKILWNIGGRFGAFPSVSKMTPPPDEKDKNVVDFVYPAGVYYRIQLFKMRELRLSSPAGDAVLPSGNIAYNYVISNNPASAALSLHIGELKIVSTPACTTDGAKTVNFNTVTPALLRAGITRDLDFAISCKSDYGNYSVKASMTTTTPSPDGGFILVKDASGNKDRLKIRITNSSGEVMKVNGTTSEVKNGVTSMGETKFNWKAMLIAGNEATPAGGSFTAKAEIIFDIQ